MKVTLLDSTGEVVGILQAPDQAHVDMNIPAGGSFTEEMPPDNAYRFNGAWVVKPTQPSIYHRWDKNAKQWTDPRTLQTLKELRWEDMKAARETDMNAPLQTPFGVFDSDEVSRKNITDTIMLLQNMDSVGMGPASTNFTLHDNSVVSVNTTQMVQVGLLLGQKIEQAYARGRVVRDAINAATTAAQVEAVTWR